MSSDDAIKTAVTVDMERIFGGLARRNLARSARADELAAPARKRKAGGPSRLALIALAAVLLLGSALTAAMLLRPVFGLTSSPASDRPAILPAASAQEVAAAPRPAPPLPAATPPMGDDLPAPVSVPTVTREEPRPSQTAAERASPPPSPTARSTPSRREASAASLCRDGPDREQCLYREVRRADLRLREAYDWAADLAVPVGEMRQVRRLWNRALDRSLDDPVGTIQTLDALSTRLHDAPEGVPSGSRR